MKHYSVLKEEAIKNLNLKEDSIIIDATLGYGGHSSEILKVISNGYLYGFDQDIKAIEYSKDRLSKISDNFKLIHTNFVNLKEYMNDIKVDGILFDLGVSSPQLDEMRGFSFMKDEVLDMRMNQEQELDAKVIVNTYSESELTKIFFEYGEERNSRNIAKKIVASREKEINTTFELVEIIKSAVGANYFYKKHPERQIFQAIRIEVNQELSILENSLNDALSLLKSGGRLCVITFHSLEDRIVKHLFKSITSVSEVYSGLRDIPEEHMPKYKLVTRKPILPSDEELNINTRSHSAKLRVVERV